MSEQIEIYPDADILAREAAGKLLQLATGSVAARGRFTLALAGGSTPRKLYALLATDPTFAAFPWAETHLFWSDERHVAPDHAESNYLMVQKTLLSSGEIPEAQVHRIEAELPDAGEAATRYEATLHAFFSAPETQAAGFPIFDAILLGMGPDGHTASLFPGSAALAERKRWVVSNWVEKFKTDRITFTFPVINAARTVLMLVAGPDKTEMLHEVLTEKADYPVRHVQPDGAKIWMLDQAAAARLPQEVRA